MIGLPGCGHGCAGYLLGNQTRERTDSVEVPRTCLPSRLCPPVINTSALAICAASNVPRVAIPPRSQSTARVPTFVDTQPTTCPSIVDRGRLSLELSAGQ